MTDGHCPRAKRNVHVRACAACCVQVSAIEQERIEIDPDTKDLLDALDFKDIPNLSIVTPQRQ
jgi:Ribosomal S17